MITSCAGGGSRGRTLTDLAQLLALWNLAFARPVVNTVAGDVFVNSGWSHFEALVFGLAFMTLPPAALLGLEVLAGRRSERAGRLIHVAALSLLAGAFLAGMLKRANPDEGNAITLGFLLGAAVFPLLFWRFKPFRLFIAFLAVVVPLFAIPLFTNASTPRLVLEGDPPLASGPADGPPVVLVVFDEFPVTSLVDGANRLDERRLPNFARLARDSTWYRNATANADETQYAVPSLFSGRVPRAGEKQASRGNIFTLVGKNYRMNVHEEQTRLCPVRLCPDNELPGLPGRIASGGGLAARLALEAFIPERVSDTLFGRATSFPAENNRRDLEAGIQPGRAPSLNVLHELLPHSPFSRLPDGRGYEPGLERSAWLPGSVPDPTSGFVAVEDDRITNNRVVAHQAWQAHLLQAGAADAELEHVLARLRATGQYDRSLIIVTADHGASLVPGNRFRHVGDENAPEITGIPMFVKLPGQQRGGADPRIVRSVDIVPTIADVLGVRPGWKIDGRPVSARPRTPPRRVTIFDAFDERRVTVATADLVRGRAKLARRQAQLFGPGTPAVELDQIGPKPALVGRPPTGLKRLTPVLDHAEALADVDPRADGPPVAISGALEDADSGDAVAITVNGRIAVTTWVYPHDGRLWFSAIVPPRALRAGPNDVALFAL